MDCAGHRPQRFSGHDSEAVFRKNLLYAVKWIENNAGLRVNLQVIITEQ